MTTVTISMPESLKEFLDQEVESKGYGNVSEYMRELLRGARAREAEARLQALLLEGLASGESVPVTDDFWRQLKADAGRMLAARRKPAKRSRARA